MRELRLIATDLDGTFLSPDGTVSALNAQAAQAATDAGVLFVVATGRPSRWLDPLDGLTSAHPVVIISNGAALFDLSSRTLVEVFPLDASSVALAGRKLRAAVPGITFLVEHGNRFGCEPDSPAKEGEDWMTVAPLEELLQTDEPCLKLLAFHPELTSEELADEVVELTGDQFTVTYSAFQGWHAMVEISARGVDKGAALAGLCRGLGIRAEQVATFGDMPNDVAMLSWSGHPHVVGNAHASLLDRFPVIGRNDDSGVGRAIFDLLGMPAPSSPARP